LQIETVMPLDVHYFTRDDGQRITLMIFLCRITHGNVVLSEEHTEYKWVDLRNHKDQFPEWLHKVIDRYNKLKYNL